MQILGLGGDMKRNKSTVSKAESYTEIGEFWDSHDLEEHWEKTKSVTFEVDLRSEQKILMNPKI